MTEERRLVIFEPSGLRISINEGNSILDAARSLGIYISSECGGRGTCGKCMVGVQPPGPISDADSKHLADGDLENGLRLACMARPSKATRVVLLQTATSVKVLLDGTYDAEVQEIDPALEGSFGIAVDLGTTTIVAYLMSLNSGVQIAHSAALNPQVAYGEDVMSRLTYTQKEETARHRLQNLVISKISELIDRLLVKNNIPSEALARITIVGNPAMHHILLGLDTAPLCQSPYQPVVLDALSSTAQEIGLTTSSAAEIYFAPNIAGFVGGDTAAFILSQRLHKSDETILGIDIGTNGEIVLSNNGKLFCCSAAAGSAFEGATISQGMRGQDGAIEHVKIEDPESQPKVSIIGNEPPVGICGSGIIDLTAELLRVGILNESGRMLGSEGRYLVVKRGYRNAPRDIFFTQKDVRQVQLAKGAILAGTAILLNHADVRLVQVSKIYLAGAFGNYINPESALQIGLLPPLDIDQIVPVGNAAGDGAKKLLLSKTERKEIEQAVRNVGYIELASYKNFAKVFSVATTLKPEMPL